MAGKLNKKIVAIRHTLLLWDLDICANRGGIYYNSVIVMRFGESPKQSTLFASLRDEPTARRGNPKNKIIPSLRENPQDFRGNLLFLWIASFVSLTRNDGVWWICH